MAELKFWLKSTWSSLAKPENWLSTNDQQPIQLNFEKSNGQMLLNPGVESYYLAIYSERLTAVIAAKGDSKMYWIRGVNSYVN